MRIEFKRPKDIKQFWLAPHCGPGTLDADEICGFCGRPNKECARELSDQIRKHPNYVSDGNILEDGQDDDDIHPKEEGPLACGGSGFWCSGCGRFWAQDSCGESSAEEHRAADGAKLVLKEGSIYCVCGKKLMRQRIWED